MQLVIASIVPSNQACKALAWLIRQLTGIHAPGLLARNEDQGWLTGKQQRLRKVRAQKSDCFIPVGKLIQCSAASMLDVFTYCRLQSRCCGMSPVAQASVSARRMRTALQSCQLQCIVPSQWPPCLLLSACLHQPGPSTWSTSPKLCLVSICSFQAMKQLFIETKH